MGPQGEPYRVSGFASHGAAVMGIDLLDRQQSSDPVDFMADQLMAHYRADAFDLYGFLTHLESLLQASVNAKSEDEAEILNQLLAIGRFRDQLEAEAVTEADLGTVIRVDAFSRLTVAGTVGEHIDRLRRDGRHADG